MDFNKACPKDDFLLPNLDMLVDTITNHEMFLFMDGSNGYNNIKMNPKNARMIAFRYPFGNFYYTVMPFGLKNIGGTYQRAMTVIFLDMIHDCVEDYVDDLVVKSKERKEHLKHLRKVFERCRVYELKMNPLKCVFGMTKGKFLDFFYKQRWNQSRPR